MPFRDNIIILPYFRIGDMCVTRDEEGNVNVGLSEAEQETPLDLGSPGKNEYVLQNIGTAFRYVDVFDQEYMAMVLAERFPPTAARPAVVRRVQVSRQRW
jgi:hypothetical protein